MAVDPFVWVPYTNDKAVVTGQIKVHASIATALSFTPEEQGAHPAIVGRPRKLLRYVRAKNTVSPFNEIQATITTLGDASYALGASITWRDTKTYKVIGLFGEVVDSVSRR